MDIRSVVTDAFTASQQELAVSSSKGELHRTRSKRFVECLANGLRQALSGIDNVASMSKHNDRNRTKFGMNELLFDVTVIEYSSVYSATSKKELFFVTKGLWIVESEMANDKRQALYDFNKLVLGSADNKLFVGPRIDIGQEADYLRVLREPAAYCRSPIFVALIPHPREWPVESPQSVKMWEWHTEDWRPIQ